MVVWVKERKMKNIMMILVREMISKRIYRLTTTR